MDSSDGGSSQPDAVGSGTRREASTDESQPWRNRRLTIPNVICATRLAGAFVMLGVAFSGRPQAFVTMFVVLNLSDFIDGRIARWLNQRSDFGARLDSLADSVLYGSLFIGGLYLKWDVLQHELPWIIMAFASYALTTGYGLWKYGKVPSYHTYGAKLTQWLLLFGAVALLMEWAVWPFRIAATAGTLTNLEATAITYVLDEWRADVLTIRHVLSRRREGVR
ncbi:MAG: CDP-alcohol phosphatidyltransferase family protein [Planctomycetaceae bacterium]